MRSPNLIREELADLEKVLRLGNELKQQMPNDYALNLTLQDDESRRDFLLAELRDAITNEIEPVEANAVFAK